MNNDSQIKLFKDWVSYPDRIQKDKDNMSVWEEKDSKGIAQGKNEGLIIVRKRQRKLRVHKNVDTVEFDEYVSVNDKSLSDFTDSEDECGAMNQPKNKVKKPQQTHSKAFLKLENQVLEAEKMLKYGTNQSDEKRLRDEVSFSKHRTNEMCKTKNKNKSIKSVELLKTHNEVKCGSTTNKIINSHNQVKPLQVIPSKCIKLEKGLREEDAALKHEPIKVFKSNKNDKSVKLVELLKTQNEVKCGSTTNKIINSLNQAKPLQVIPSKCIKLEKGLREEDTTLKHGPIKVFKSNKNDKFVKSVELLKTQNKVKCGSTTNKIINSHNQVKLLQVIPSKCIKLEKRLREEDTSLKHGPIKVFKSNKNDKSVKSVQLLTTQNEVKFSNNTNTFFNVNNQKLVRTKNKDNVCSYEEVLLIGSNKEENQKSLDGLRQVDVITLDENMQNNCKVFDDNFDSSISTYTEVKHQKINEQNYGKYTKRIESAVITIEDDDEIIISDHEYDVQLLSMPVKPVCSSLKTNKPCSLKTNSNKSYNSVSANRQITNTNYINNQETSSMIHKLSPSVTIIPTNVNIPKDIVVTMVKTPQADSNFNSIKRKSATLNAHLSKNSSIINVKCELISKPNLNEEVKFYVRLPNGTERPVSNEIINQYLRQHNNQLPDFWSVPLAVEDVKQYGVN